MDYKKLWKENWDLVLALGILIAGFLFAGRLADLFLGSMNRSGDILAPAIKIALVFFGITLVRSIVLKGLPKWRWLVLLGILLLGLFSFASAFGALI
jgi:hypothetical protein